MTLQVLLSAMNLKDESYIDSLNITGDCVVVNQCGTEEEPRIITRESGQKIKYIKSDERGLSRSRNMAIKNADAEICILCDNDVEYVDGYEELILNEFKKRPKADIIIFYIRRKEKPTPNYNRAKKMGYLSVLKIFSPEIAFRRKSVLGMRFDEQFGAGSGKYQMGEENIFLYDCLRTGKNIWYAPIMIAKLREEKSTWFKGYNKQFFVSRGANYAAMSRAFSHILIWQFAIRKRALYSRNFSVRTALNYMYTGRKEYLRMFSDRYQSQC